jgi:hypothetical protein
MFIKSVRSSFGAEPSYRRKHRTWSRGLSVMQALDVERAREGALILDS